MKSVKTKQGFTLVELSLALGFLGFMSLIIAVITNSMLETYQKGLVLKQVNTVGAEIVEEIRSSIRDSAAKGINAICETSFTNANRTNCVNSGASSLISTRYMTGANAINVKNASNTVVKTIGSAVPAYGSFCTGTYSYIWNSGYLLGSNYSTAYKPLIFQYYLDVEGAGSQLRTAQNFRLLKIYDPSRSVCLAQNAGYGYSSSASINKIIKVNEGINLFQEPATEVLSTATNNDLTIFDMEIYTASYNKVTGNIFYQGSFILGTMTGGINIMSVNGNYCSVPTELAGDFFDYCAINKFSFASQAVGE